jgi:hypothetical protein
MRRRILGVVAVLAMLTGAVVFAARPAPADVLDRYLRAAAGAEPDRGWGYLPPITRRRSYGNDAEAYVRAADAVDWAAFRWSEARTVWNDDGISLVEVEVLSPIASVPTFLLESRILNGRCRGSQPYGLGTYVPVVPWRAPTVGGGGLSGSQMQCDARFIGDMAYQRDDR